MQKAVVWLITVLSIEEYKGSGLQNIINKIKGDEINVKLKSQGKLNIKHILYKKYRKNVCWRSIDELINSKQKVLYSGTQKIPKEVSFRVYKSNTLKERLAENAAIYLLKSFEEKKKKPCVCLIDEFAMCKEIAEEIVQYTDDFFVITKNTEEYKKMQDEMLKKFGAMILVEKSFKNIKGASLVISPKMVKKKIQLKTNTVVLSGCKNEYFSSGIVFDGYKIQLPKSLKSVKVHSLPDEYFAQAMYDLNRESKLAYMVPDECINNGKFLLMEEVKDILLKQIENA